MGTRRLALLFLLTAACGEPRRVVTIGDNVASNPTIRTSWVGLLAANDDALFPAFAGKGFAKLEGDGYELVRLDRGGDSFKNIASAPAPFCTCAGSACEEKTEPCLDTTSTAETTLIVELGGNDLLNGFIRILNVQELQGDPTPVLADLRRDVQKVLAMTQDTALFPVAPKVHLLNVVDPSDGAGDFAAIGAMLFPANLGFDLGKIKPELALRVIADSNALIAGEGAKIGATLVDVHAHFLGHGYHHGDAGALHYDASDPSQWLRGIFDPTLRGAHEIRRLLWTSLSGETIADVPKDLPAEGTLGLPAVPEDGWAKAIADSKITQTLHSDSLGVDWPNNDNDPNLALGKPDGHDAVAIGVIGAYLVVDLGASTQALDGEGDDLVVIEFGAQSGGVPEPYRVSVAAEKDGPFVPLADGRGERSWDLASAGVKSARFIKVESLASAVDVLGGLGSPTAPGPEIDGIGAVHPGAP